MPEFIYRETEAAELAGLPLKKFAAARVKFLWQGIDWDLDGMQVAYCEAGLLSVLEKITGKNSPELLLKFGQKNAPEKCHVEQAEVTRIYPNPHLLQARLKETGILILVRCRVTKNFRIGMELPVLKVEGTGVYSVARRLPRFGGRW